MFSFHQGDKSKGTKSVRFDLKGTRLLCSEVEQPIVCYNLPTLAHPIASESIRLAAQGYSMQEGSLKEPNTQIMKSPCCFAGANDELLVRDSRDNGIYIWSALDGRGKATATSCVAWPSRHGSKRSLQCS